MKRNAYEDSTIQETGKRLRHLQKHCDLSNPENLKTYIATLKKKDGSNASNGYKETLIEAYDKLIQSTGQE